MTSKPGLLPKWLFTYTALRIVYILAVHRHHLNIFRSSQKSRSAYVYLAFVLGLTRLLASRRITRFGFYSSIAASFLAEGVFFIYGGLSDTYPLHRVVLEVFLALFTLGWMVFLYPYYLLEGKEQKRE